MTPRDPGPKERSPDGDRSDKTWVPDEESEKTLPLNDPDPDDFDNPEGEGEEGHLA